MKILCQKRFLHDLAPIQPNVCTAITDFFKLDAALCPFVVRTDSWRGTAKVPSAYRSGIEKFVFDDVPMLTSMAESGRIERMKGYKGCYKVRFGDFRIGLRVAGDTVVFERVLNGKDIYRFFP